MSATPTPGPWKAKRHRSNHDSFNVYAPDPSEHAVEGDLTIVAEYLTEANAKLIAAAPEQQAKIDALADALEAVHSEMLDRYPHGEPDAPSLVRQVRAALRAAGRL